MVTERARKALTSANVKGVVFHPIICVPYESPPDTPADERWEQAFAPEELQGKIWGLTGTKELNFEKRCGMQPVVCKGCGSVCLTPPRETPARFNLADWHGEEIVVLPTQQDFFATERFADLIEERRLTGIHFDSMDEFGPSQSLRFKSCRDSQEE